MVACPKCKADLLIPRPDSRQRGRRAGRSLGGRAEVRDIPGPGAGDGVRDGDGRGGRAAPSSYLDEIAAIIPPELAALRPEDLRVEAEFFETITREPPPPPAPAADDPFQFPAELIGSRPVRTSLGR